MRALSRRSCPVCHWDTFESAPVIAREHHVEGLEVQQARAVWSAKLRRADYTNSWLMANVIYPSSVMDYWAQHLIPTNTCIEKVQARKN